MVAVNQMWVSLYMCMSVRVWLCIWMGVSVFRKIVWKKRNNTCYDDLICIFLNNSLCFLSRSLSAFTFSYLSVFFVSIVCALPFAPMYRFNHHRALLIYRNHGNKWTRVVSEREVYDGPWFGFCMCFIRVNVFVCWNEFYMKLWLWFWCVRYYRFTLFFLIYVYL